MTDRKTKVKKQMMRMELLWAQEYKFHKNDKIKVRIELSKSNKKSIFVMISSFSVSHQIKFG